MYATKTNAVVQTGKPDRLYTFDEVYSLINGMNQRIESLENKVQVLQNQVDSNENTTNISLLSVYPVGSIYVSTESINPGSIFGGTWVAFGAGRTLVGVDSSQTEFSTVGLTGGEKTHILTIDEIPSHDHMQNAVTSDGNHNPIVDNDSGEVWGATQPQIYGYNQRGSYVKTRLTGGSKAHNNLQPYITVYMWKRTA